MLALLCTPGLAPSHPADENPDLTLSETVEQFRRARFGIAIHWDPARPDCADSSTTAPSKLLNDFNPAKFDSTKWVTLAKSSGAHYLITDSNNSDGLALWESETAPRNVVENTTYGRDIVKALAYECARQGIQYFVGYNVGGQTPDELRELLSWYGKIGGVRLSGLDYATTLPINLHTLYEMVHKLQPSAMIGNDFLHEDDLPGENFRIVNDEDYFHAPRAPVVYKRLPVELSQTVNGSRYYCSSDKDYRSDRELIQSLVRAAGLDMNLLLHIGASPEGDVPPEISERLLAVGKWLSRYGASIYSTRGGPADAAPWGVTTHRYNRVYVHVLDATATTITLKVQSPIVAARYFSDEAEADYKQTEDEVTLTLRPERTGEMERLIVLWTK